MPTKTKRQLNEEIKILKGRLEKPAASTAVIEPTGTLEDSIKVRDVEIANLKDSIIRNQQTTDTQIAQLQDSLTKSDAAFLQVTAELSDAISYEHERAIVVDFLDKLTPEGKIALSERLGLATVEDSAELGDKVGVEDIHESFVNGQREQAVKQIKRYGAYDFFDDYKRYLESSNYPMGEQFMYFTDATGSYLKRTGKGKLKDTPQPEDELKPRIPGTPVLPDAETKPEEKPEETAQVADIQPEESPGEKWWREFQEGLNK
jgi:hypothetical protein